MLNVTATRSPRDNAFAGLVRPHFSRVACLGIDAADDLLRRGENPPDPIESPTVEVIEAVNDATALATITGRVRHHGRLLAVRVENVTLHRATGNVADPGICRHVQPLDGRPMRDADAADFAALGGVVAAAANDGTSRKAVVAHFGCLSGPSPQWPAYGIVGDYAAGHPDYVAAG